MTSSDETIDDFRAAASLLFDGWYWFVIIGVVALIGGLLALANPFQGTLAVTMIVGVTFCAVAIVQIIQAFQISGWGGRIAYILLGLLFLFIGFSMFQHPFAGMMSLTIMVAILLLSGGVFKLIIAFQLNGKEGRIWIILSAIASIVLAILIFSDFPQSAAVMLGIFLGIELLFDGISMIMAGLAIKKVGNAVTE